MDIKILLVLCFSMILLVEAQRDGKRRSNRRKPVTEAPPEAVEPESENNPQKLNEDTAEKVPVVDELSKADPNPPNESSSVGPSFIAPRGSRKPRPMRGNGVTKPRPTLPAFARKSQRMKPKRVEETTLSTTTTTGAKPQKSRRRNQAPDTNIDNSNDSSTETPKKRFGGRRQSRARQVEGN